MKKAWRILFQVYEVGDKVQVIDQHWVFKNMKGKIVERLKGQGYHDGEYLYLVEFNPEEFHALHLGPGTRERQDKEGFPPNCGGYFSFGALKLL